MAQINIAGTLHNTEQIQGDALNSHVVAHADEILDSTQEKKQSEINADVQSELNAHDEAINAPSTGLEARVETLEEQVAFSGDFQTANTPADVVSGSGKITTANAVAAIAEQLKAEVGYYPCTTAAGTAAKVIPASDAPNYVLTVGGSVKVKMTNKNTAANPTLKIGNAEAKPLYYGAIRASSSNTWEAGEVIEVYYDGENLMANNVEGGGGDGVFDISAYNASGEPLAPAVYNDLTAALGASGANVPASKRKGGMSVKFIQGTEQNSDNKYVQYLLTKDEWSISETDWEKMNLEEEISQLSQKYADVKKNDLLTCLALTQAQIDSLAKIPHCVIGVGVSPTYTTSDQLYWKYAGKRSGRDTGRFEITNGDGTTIDSISLTFDHNYGIIGSWGTNNKFYFLIDLRTAYEFDDHTGSGNWYDYGQTLPIDFASIQLTELSKILANSASISTLLNLPAEVANKVDKVEGKGLSTNDYTDADKNAVSQLFGETTSRSYVKTNGRLNEYIPAKASKKYNISFTSDNVVWPSCRFLCYDDSSYLNVEITVNSGETGILETPAGTTKILAFISTSLSGETVNVSITIASNGVVDGINAELDDMSDSIAILEDNTLIGKKIMCFGDSITEFNTAGKGWVEHASELGGDFIRGACGGSRYVPRATATDTPTTNPEAKGNFDIANLVDAWVNNHWAGVDASVEYLEGQHAASVANLKANPVSSVDMVVLMGGTNDFSSNISIGEVTDINTTTVLGAIKHCVQVILTANPKIKIYILSPLVRYFGSDITDRTDANWCDNYANNTGKTTADMVDAQGDVAKYMHTPFCNLYYELGWNQYNFSEYFRDDDNTHPHKGFKVLAERIHSWLTARL